MGANHAGRENALAGVGEDEVVVDAPRQLELAAAKLVARLVDVAGKGQDATSAFEALVNENVNRLHGDYLREEPSSSDWRLRSRVPITLLRLSSMPVSRFSTYSLMW